VGKDRGKLKFVSHRHKLSKFGIPHPNCGHINIGMLSLCKISYETADKGLISNFIERWHWDTNIFHLPILYCCVCLVASSQFCSCMMLDFSSGHCWLSYLGHILVTPWQSWDNIIVLYTRCMRNAPYTTDESFPFMLIC